MKFLDIAIFLFMINVFGAIFFANASEMGLSEFVYLEDLTSDDVTTMEKEVRDEFTNKDISELDPEGGALGIIYSGIKGAFESILTPITKYIFWFPRLIIKLCGVEIEPFAIGMGIVFLLIQVIGLFQIITGRSFQQVD